MPYTINRYKLLTDPDSKFPFTVGDNTIENTKTSLSYLGKGVTNYAQSVAQDLVYLLENFAGPTEPSNKITGQFWYDTANKSAKFYDGANWRVLNPSVSYNNQPANPGVGDLWFNALSNQLFVWNGSSFVLVGPQSSDPTNNAQVFQQIGSAQVIRIILDGQTIGLWASANVSVGQLVNNPAPYNDVTNFPGGLNLGLNIPPSALFSGTSVSAQYADLAERYQIDHEENSEIGTVVVLGGINEITVTEIDADTNVFGVISENPGMRLNAGAGSDQSHPYVALAGRVPCKVLGSVKKGDRLVTSHIPGVARAATAAELKKMNQLSFFGRALENKESEEVELLRIVVGLK